MNAPVPFPRILKSTEELADLIRTCQHEPRVALDTESNSLYAYREEVCLIQLSTSREDVLIDPLVIPDLSPLGELLADPQVEKVFHAVDYDAAVLLRDFGFRINYLFDTMWAARVLGWPQVGLGALLEQHFGVRTNKRYQRYNWGQRPLDEEAIRYAALDTHYLLPLRELQRAELERLGRWEEAQEIFTYLTQSIAPAPVPTVEELFWRIKGVHDLTPQEQQYLYALHLWRENTARCMGRPTFKVLSDAQLIALARHAPAGEKALAQCDLPQALQRRFGAELLKALRHPQPPPSQRHEGERPSEATQLRYEQLKAWRKRIAEKRGVDPDVILPNAALWRLAQEPPTDLAALLQVPGIGPWRQKTYGPELLALLGNANQAVADNPTTNSRR